tara:strand:+ start:24816 stop:25049 length:234 start_codon:yes stop_codon:yes gene_type:complete
MNEKAKKEFAEVKFIQERNNLLFLSDWTQMPDCQLTDDKKTEWQNYRQALRDLPANTTPSINEKENLTGVEWPNKPE